MTNLHQVRLKSTNWKVKWFNSQREQHGPKQYSKNLQAHLGLSWPLVFSWIRVPESLDSCVVFCRLLYCLSVYDLWLLNTSLVSSNVFLNNYLGTVNLINGVSAERRLGDTLGDYYSVSYCFRLIVRKMELPEYHDSNQHSDVVRLLTFLTHAPSICTVQII